MGMRVLRWNQEMRMEEFEPGNHVQQTKAMI